MTDPWFARPVPRPGAAVQLFCLPYAGSGASVFRAWPQALGPSVDVYAAQLPGRESRFGEPPGFDPDEVADAVAARVDRPFAIFGHSLGGRLGFEVIRRLRDGGDPLPVRFYASGCRPPDDATPDRYTGIADRDDADLVAAVASGGGAPAAVLADPELLELLLPALRSDLAWLDAYRYVPEPPLPVPVLAFAGTDDTVATPAAMAGWRRVTRALIGVRTFEGGHFFLHDRLTDLAATITADLAMSGVR